MRPLRHRLHWMAEWILQLPPSHLLGARQGPPLHSLHLPARVSLRRCCSIAAARTQSHGASMKEQGIGFILLLTWDHLPWSSNIPLKVFRFFCSEIVLHRHFSVRWLLELDRSFLMWLFLLLFFNNMNIIKWIFYEQNFCTFFVIREMTT